MEENNRNFLLAMALSILVLFAWQAFFVRPEAERVKNEAVQQAQNKPADQPGSPPLPGVTPQPGVAQAPAGTPSAPSIAPGQSRDIVLTAQPRIGIDTPSLKGSIALKGARLDDLVLKEFKVSVRPDSQNVILFSPSGSPEPYYAEHGFAVAPDAGMKAPTADTVWTAEAGATLTPAKPVTLTWDNGEGVTFRRTIAVDDEYMFTVTQEVENKGAKPITLHPYALISRHGHPTVEGLYILHEGLLGVLGEEGLQEIGYKDALEKKTITFKSTSGWLGFTDKYWAATLIPNQKQAYEAHFTANAVNNREFFQTDYLLSPLTVAPGAKESISSMVFAGAKQVNVIDAYETKYGIKLFERMIDWGWFYFITKPLFHMLDFFYKLVGNFGISILIVTVLVKLLFFPLANKSYESMSKMKKLQPEMKRLQERYKDDKMKQQQELMALYKKEKINPMSGCLPILIQIPVFFALYKVLYVTIEMRHAPFFGWIRDLSAPDPTTLFNLFGLIPWDPPQMLMVGIWPIIMGVTMFFQMKLNPAPPDPIQQQIFTWMPLLFTFLLASFPAGLVIYWSWNNILSMTQQWIIMRRQGVEVNLLENMGFGRKSENSSPGKAKP
jgi:YidC/Oxa1 family membrane protein insertase